MSRAADRIFREALGLSDRERAEIAARLLESLDEQQGQEPGEIDNAWAAEIERRCAALDAGATGVTDWEEVRRLIEVEILRK